MITDRPPVAPSFVDSSGSLSPADVRAPHHDGPTTFAFTLHGAERRWLQVATRFPFLLAGHAFTTTQTCARTAAVLFRFINWHRTWSSMVVTDRRCWSAGTYYRHSISRFSRNGTRPMASSLPVSSRGGRLRRLLSAVWRPTGTYLHVVPRASTDDWSRRTLPPELARYSRCTRASVCVRALVQQPVHAIAAKTKTYNIILILITNYLILL